ncbi:hypothetical protein RMATCC62417_03695 [Rhizopus microsporus]|nr:hypothetical protein RMATCC62417_03695 [Rhizopus microsporus]
MHPIDNNKTQSSSGLLIFSPRSLQLLKQINLLDAITAKGMKHWRLDIYEHNVLADSIQLWDNDVTGYNYCLSCEQSIVCDILRHHVSLDVMKERITKIEDQGDFKRIELSHGQCWKSQFVLVENDDTNLVRQTLGIGYKYHNNKRYFYTLQIAILQSNFPSIRQISVIKKNQESVVIVGHQDTLNIIFEHKPSWSKVSIDDEIPVALALGHIKYMMDPFQAEFGRVKSYTKWKGDQRSSELFEHEGYFFIGLSSQTTSPLLDINAYFEGVQNLCWKLGLVFRQCASTALLDTVNQETQLKSAEYIQTSIVWMERMLSTSPLRETRYQLDRLKRCFVGDTPYASNLINCHHQEISSTFEFTIGAGCLAPNGKLKPYSLVQLLLLTNTKPTKPTTTQLKPSSSTSIEHSRGRSSSMNNSNLSNLFNIFQKGHKKQNSTSSNKMTVVTERRSSERWKSIRPNYLQLLDCIQSTSQFTLLVFCGSLSTFESSPLSKVTQQISSPISFLYHYTPDMMHNSSSPTARWSASSIHSFYQRRSTDTTRSSFEDSLRFSYRPQPPSEPDLFSIMFISNSTKQEANQYLTQTPPSVVHSTWPFGLDKVYLDHDQQCYKTYEIKQPEIIVIRPDGYIGTRVDNYDQLCLYFDSFLTSPNEHSAAAVVAASYYG